jgi:hypothetical protein
VTLDDHPFATVFGATEHIRKSILGFSDGHGSHRPVWPIWPFWTQPMFPRRIGPQGRLGSACAARRVDWNAKLVFVVHPRLTGHGPTLFAGYRSMST